MPFYLREGKQKMLITNLMLALKRVICAFCRNPCALLYLEDP
jgi:hypothetical protein